MDNCGTHKYPAVKTWFGEHPCDHVHFAPTGASWLDQVERWFAEITRKRIRRGTFHSVPELVRAIHTSARTAAVLCPSNGGRRQTRSHKGILGRWPPVWK